VKSLPVVLLLVTLAWAARSYAPCPIDKEEAAYEGVQKDFTEHGELVHKCKFRHEHIPRGGGDGKVHEFWASCED